MIAALLLCTGHLYAEDSVNESSSNPIPISSETEEAAELPGPSSLTIAWDAESQQLTTPSDHAARQIGEQMRLFLATRAEALEKAGLLEPQRLENGMIRQRVSPEHFSTMIFSPESAVTTCNQHAAPAASAATVDQIDAEHRPHSTPSTEGWVAQ